MNKVVEINGRTEQKPRAPAVLEKLEAAQAALRDLETEVGQTALEASENAPGAVKRLADLRSRIAGAEREVGELTRAHETALRLDRQSAAAGAIKMRREQLAAFKGHMADREKAMATAIEHAGKMATAFAEFLSHSEKMVSVLPSGTVFPTLAMGDNGLSGNILGACDRLLLAEMFRIGAQHAQPGRGLPVLPFSKPQIVQQRDEPGKIPPQIDTLREAHAVVLREIEGQVTKLDSQAMERATQAPKGAAA
jgi:hypothetical protein